MFSCHETLMLTELAPLSRCGLLSYCVPGNIFRSLVTPSVVSGCWVEMLAGFWQEQKYKKEASKSQESPRSISKTERDEQTWSPSCPAKSFFKRKIIESTGPSTDHGTNETGVRRFLHRLP